MRLSRYLDDVVVRAPAKVNLHLEVLGKRPDGYHAIETLMVTVGLYDSLVFRADQSDNVRLDCTDRTLSTGPDNLVVKAARLLKERTGCAQGASIRLVKRIPMAAGLAGGSSDAAATLLGLNELWRLGLKGDELSALGAEIGSDVPFFVGGPAAWCSGRGEIIDQVATDAKLDLVLVCPEFGMATAAVYKNVAVPAQPTSGAAIKAALSAGRIEELGKLLFNRLQPAAERIDPRIREHYNRLAALSPAGQLMSGSGSTLYALCRGRDEAGRIAADLSNGAEARHERVFMVRGCV